MKPLNLSITVQELDGKPVAVYIRLTKNKVRRTKELRHNFMVDYDSKNNVVGVEIICPDSFSVKFKRKD